MRSEPEASESMDDARPPLLAVENLRVDYGRARVLFDVSFEIEAGGAVTLLGANGAGKSTLARALSGLVTPSGGRIVFDGEDITGAPTYRIARRGLVHVPEGRGVFPGLSVADNLRMMLRHLPGETGLAERVERALRFFPVLAERRKQAAGTLSGGEQQMLALARVLASAPRLVVADELSLGLAPLLIDAIFEALETARREGVTVLLIEQFVDRALSFADTALFLRRGRLSWAGPAAEARDAVLDEYLGRTEAPTQ